jgi:hypothetical protein
LRFVFLLGLPERGSVWGGCIAIDHDRIGGRAEPSERASEPSRAIVVVRCFECFEPVSFVFSVFGFFGGGLDLAAPVAPVSPVSGVRTHDVDVV